MAQPIVLFDFARESSDPNRRAWSPHTWKTRFALNYKGIPYKTEWLEYPDVESTCIQYGVSPTAKWADGSPKYTLPALYDPNTRTAVAESFETAKYLDQTYPSTPAIVPEGVHALQLAVVDALVQGVWDDLAATMDFRAAGLSSRSLEYVSKKYGIRLNVTQDERAREAPKHWETLESMFGKIKGWLSANGPGRDGLVMGDKICYADSQLAALLVSARNIFGEDSEEWKRICGWHDGYWKRVFGNYEAFLTVKV